MRRICPHCHGSGIVPGKGRTVRDGHSCPICSGSGRTSDRDARGIEEEFRWHPQTIEINQAREVMR